MGAVYRKSYTKPLPPDAQIVTSKGKRIARWRPHGGGRIRTAPLTTGANGQSRIRITSKTYTAKYRDGADIVREVATGCRDEGAARAVLADLEKRAELVRANVITTEQESIADQQTIPLADHIGAYVEHLRGKGASGSHISDWERSLRRIAGECRFDRLSNLDRSCAEKWLRGIRDAGRSARTVNAHRAALVAFGNWCVATSRLVSNPFAAIPKANERIDRRRRRRALTVDELLRLFDAARQRPIADAETVTRGPRKGLRVAKISAARRAKLERLGWERALIYKALVLTGLRRGELASLTVGQLELDAPTPYAILEAADEKNREGSSIPLRADLVADLRLWLDDKLRALQAAARKRGSPILSRLAADTPVLNVPKALVKILDRDLEFAGVPKHDERGRSVDVHSLRMTFGTYLSAGGVPLRTAQSAMRHSDPKLTANTYTDPKLLDVAGALDALPRLPLTDDTRREAACASGGPQDTPLAPMLAPTPAVSGRSESSADTLPGLPEAHTETREITSIAPQMPGDGRLEACAAGGEVGRGGQIRTDDLLLPKQALCQAELHPDDSSCRLCSRGSAGDCGILGRRTEHVKKKQSRLRSEAETARPFSLLARWR